MTTPSLKEKTAKGLLWGSINSGAQQVLNLVFGIFLARLLSPADYGMVGMLTIFTLIASTLQESGFISGLNRKENVTEDDYNAVFWFNVLCSLTVYVILFFSAPLIAAWFRQPVLVPLARLSFLSFVISALNTSPRAWLFRNMRVRETAILSTVALIVSGITGIALAWNGFAYWGIAIQNLTFCIMLTVGSWWYADWHPSLHINLRPLRGMIGYSSRLLATNIFAHINNNLFSLFFGRLYGEKTVGYYNQANKWTTMGYTMLTGMVWSVTQPLLLVCRTMTPNACSAYFANAAIHGFSLLPRPIWPSTSSARVYHYCHYRQVAYFGSAHAIALRRRSICAYLIVLFQLYRKPRQEQHIYVEHDCALFGTVVASRCHVPLWCHSNGRCLYLGQYALALCMALVRTTAHSFASH